MKTNEKLAFIEKKDNNLIIHSFKPNEDKLKEFRKEQIESFPKEDLMYYALARCTGEWEETEYLNSDKLEVLKDDTISTKKIGYENPYDSSFNNQYEFFCEDPRHIFRRISKYSQDNYQKEIKDYIDGKVNKIPFRINIKTSNNNDYHYFAPLFSYSSYDVAKNNSNYYVMGGILHLSYLGYLEQLLRTNRINLLSKRSKEVDGSLEKILDLFNYSDEQIINIDDVIKGEELIKKANTILYADKTFQRVDYNLDDRQLEIENRPISEDLLEQAQIDEPVIEEVNKYLKKIKK